MKRIGLALGGGAARGLAHIAFLKVFDDLKIKPAIISGTSIGALIGAYYASGLSARAIERMFRKLNLLRLVNLVDISWHRSGGLVKGEKITSFLRKTVKCENFKDLKIPLRIIATDFWSRSEKAFSRGNVVDAVRASISIPGVFEPYTIRKRVFSDGGVVNPVPYDVIRNDCDFLIAINVLGDVKPARMLDTPPGIVECIHSSFLTIQEAILENKLAASKPDMMASVSLSNINAMEFNRMKDILAGVRSEVSSFKAILKEICGKH